MELILPSGVRAWLNETSLVLFGRNEWPYDDGVPDRDPNRILPDDVQVTISMNSFVNTADSVREVHRGLARTCDPLLREIPPDAELAEFDPDLSIAKGLLTAACSSRGVLLAVATKVLHRKRPGNIPMLDSVIVAAYADALGKPALKAIAAGNKEKAGSAGTHVMAAFRHDLNECAALVASLRAVLEAKRSPMTPVRLLEVAVWMACEPRGNYRVAG